jgi:hypothetical protein
MIDLSDFGNGNVAFESLGLFAVKPQKGKGMGPVYNNSRAVSAVLALSRFS